MGAHELALVQKYYNCIYVMFFDIADAVES